MKIFVIPKVILKSICQREKLHTKENRPAISISGISSSSSASSFIIDSAVRIEEGAADAALDKALSWRDFRFLYKFMEDRIVGSS